MSEGGGQGLEVQRAAEVMVRLPDGSERRGSGYLVCAGRVLTAAHVIEGAESTDCRFDADRPGERRHPARPAFVDQAADIAVLDLGESQLPPAHEESTESGKPVQPVRPALFGSVGERDAVLRCSALGFPRFKLLDDAAGARYRDAEHIRATVPVLSNRREGTLDLQVTPPGAENPWPGMSGAAVFAADRIVGVVTRHHPGYGPGRLAAGRVDRWPELMPAERLGELSALLHTSLRGLPDVLPTSLVAQLDAGHRDRLTGIAPDRLLARADELRELAEFCGGAEPYRWIQAPPWTGKTALASWFALHPPDGVAPVSFFVTNREAASADSSDYIDAVIMQCARLAGRDPMLLASPHARADECRMLLKAAAERVAETGGTLLLLVDGLDEDRSGTRQLISVAALLPTAPPENVRVLVLSRTSPGIPADVPGGHPLRTCRSVGLTPSSAAVHTEVDATRDLALALSGGNATAVRLVGLLTVSRGGLSRGDLAELSGLDHWMLGQHLGSLFGRIVRERALTQQQFGPIAADGSKRGYLLAHETLHAAAEEALGPDLDTYRARLHSWSDGYRDAGWPARTPAYLLGGYVRMLVSTGDLARAVVLATDPVRHRRMRIETGSDWAALSEIAAVAAADDDLGDRLALGVARMVLRNRNFMLEPDHVIALAGLGESRRAVEMARSLSSPADRARALAGIALTADVRWGEDGRARAEALIAEARAVREEHRADELARWAAVDLACALAELGRTEQARELVKEWPADARVSSWARLAVAMAPHDAPGARAVLASAVRMLLAQRPGEEGSRSLRDVLGDAVRLATAAAVVDPALSPLITRRIEDLTTSLGCEDPLVLAQAALEIVRHDPARARRLAGTAEALLRRDARGPDPDGPSTSTHEEADRKWARVSTVNALVAAGMLTEAEALVDDLSLRRTAAAVPLVRALVGRGEPVRAEAWLSAVQGVVGLDAYEALLVAGLAERGDFAAARTRMAGLRGEGGFALLLDEFPRLVGQVAADQRAHAVALFDEVVDRPFGAGSLHEGAPVLLSEALAELGGPDDLADAERLVDRAERDALRARVQTALIASYTAAGRAADADAAARGLFEDARVVHRADVWRVAVLAAVRTGRWAEAREFHALVRSRLASIRPQMTDVFLEAVFAASVPDPQAPGGPGSGEEPRARLPAEGTDRLEWLRVVLGITLTRRASDAEAERALLAETASQLAFETPEGPEPCAVAALVVAGAWPEHARELLGAALSYPLRAAAPGGDGELLPLEVAFGLIAIGDPARIDLDRYLSPADRRERADECRGMLAAALVGFAPQAVANALIARPESVRQLPFMPAHSYLAQARAAQLAPRSAAADDLARHLVDELLAGEHWHHALPALTVLAPDAVRRARDAVRAYVGHLA